ncbi:plasmid recombination protein, partial [Acinetobacter soli]|uniref:plasmid recombination protein n=1 Tax=Acinetobacter soli TaxID=487316 RepID=UPI00148F2CFF
MSFAILRIQKLKSVADVGGSLSHNYRNRETLNADDARTHLNEHTLDTNEKCMSAI